MGHFTIFQSHGLSGWFVPKIIKSFLNLSKLRPKYCRSLGGHGVTEREDYRPWVLQCNVPYFDACEMWLLTDGYHGHDAPTPTDVSCRPSTDLLRSKLDLHITDNDDVMSCSDDLQTDSSQNINDSDEHRTGQSILFLDHYLTLAYSRFIQFYRIVDFLNVSKILIIETIMPLRHAGNWLQSTRWMDQNVKSVF